MHSFSSVIGFFINGQPFLYKKNKNMSQYFRIFVFTFLLFSTFHQKTSCTVVTSRVAAKFMDTTPYCDFSPSHPLFHFTSQNAGAFLKLESFFKQQPLHITSSILDDFLETSASCSTTEQHRMTRRLTYLYDALESLPKHTALRSKIHALLMILPFESLSFSNQARFRNNELHATYVYWNYVGIFARCTVVSLIAVIALIPYQYYVRRAHFHFGGILLNQPLPQP